jgi:hypothetical protein
MQLNSRFLEIDLRQIRIANEAKDAFALTTSFSFQMNADLLNPYVGAGQLWDFEIPFAFKSENGLFQVFCGWLSLQMPFQLLLPKNKMICIRVYEDKPKRLIDITWQYVFHILSRSHHRDVILAQIAKSVELCPDSVLQKLTNVTLSGSIESAMMQLCSEARQPVRTQVRKLAMSKKPNVEGGSK